MAIVTDTIRKATAQRIAIFSFRMIAFCFLVMRTDFLLLVFIFFELVN
jgi:hypothetical protein